MASANVYEQVRVGQRVVFWCRRTSSLVEAEVVGKHPGLVALEKESGPLLVVRRRLRVGAGLAERDVQVYIPACRCRIVE